MSSWSRPFTALAALALALAACGGAASPAPPAGGTSAPGTPAAAASAAPAPSDAAPTVAPSAAGQGPDVAGAASALADLDSYHLKIGMKMKGLENSTFSMFGDGLEMEGTMIVRPTQAADIAISMGAEGQKTEMGYRLVGDQAWVRIGDSWMESSAADAQSTIDSFAADKMLGSFSGVSGMTAVGDETKNGIETTHYSASADAVGRALGSSIGLPDATWSMDFWVAKDAGYAVAYAVEGKGASGSFEMTLDVTDINNPANAVEKPAT